MVVTVMEPFICKDCGHTVYSFTADGKEPRDQCLTCGWVASFPDPVEREKLRKWLNENH